MFGVSRKKVKAKAKQQVHLSTTLDDDDDDGGDDGAHHRERQIQRRQNKKKKVKGEKSKKATASVLSFDPDEGINDEYESPIDRTKRTTKDSFKRRKIHTSGGLGYGGIPAPSDGSASASESEEKIVGDDDDGGHARVGSFYDKSALEKLKSEQKLRTLVHDGDMELSHANSDLNESSVKEDNGKDSEEAFIPLPPTGKRHREESSHVLDEVILTGDEAMEFAQRDEDANNDVEFDHGLQSPPTPPQTHSLGGTATKKTRTGKSRMHIDIKFNVMDTDEQSNDEEEEGNRQWEDTMVRRAGVLPPKAASIDDDGSRGARRKQNSNPTTLGKIRASLEPTISNLENMFLDLESNISRHETTIHSTRDELARTQSILEKHGKALEYYQGLREDLATWMGALRELNGMVTKVEEAKRLLEAEMTIRKMERFVEWGNDCLEVLEKQGLLASTTIKANSTQAETSGDDTEMRSVDEFGRDLSSLSSIARIKRWNQRRKRSLLRLQDSGMLPDGQNNLEQSIACSNFDNVDSTEIEEWNQRSVVLAQALNIIPELVKEDYLSVSNLCAIFSDWKGLYSEDYASCYAKMTLVQMIEVLARLELCEWWNLLNLPRNQCLDVSDFKWFSTILKNNSQGDTIDEDAALIVLEVVEKQILNRILHSFTLDDGTKGDAEQCGNYDPFSETQTKLLCTMVKSVLRFVRLCPGKDPRVECERMAEKLLDGLFLLVRFVVEKLGVPVVDASKITMVRNQFANKDISKGFDDETADAITYATVTQAVELCNLVTNILGHWYPIFKCELCQQHDGVAALVRYILEDIVSLRLLPVLHSLHSITSGGCENDARYIVMPKRYANDIMDTIDKKASLDSAKWMLMLAPLRIAIKQWN